MATIKITKISTQKRGDRVSLYSGDDFIIGLDKDLLIKHGLGIGVELDATQISTLAKDDEIKKCFNKALHYLSYRPRSEHEVRTKLAEKYPPAVVEKVISKLKKYRYVDDAAFVNFWFDSRGRTRGAALLRAELLQKGVPKDVIEGSLPTRESEETYQEVLELVSSKKKYQHLDKKEFYKKVAPFLARRGYSYDVIKEVIKNIYED
jgi:regulatory protein